MSRQRWAVIAGAALSVAAFAIARLPLLARRDPNTDELFTIWIARKSLGGLMATLQHDSGPPLYYALVHLFQPGVTGARVLSFLAALGALACVMVATRSIWPGLLLALYPIHVYFSTEARAYALVGLGVGVAAMALERWVAGGDRRALVVGCAALLLAAYCHYYGVYFFPLPFIVGFTRARRAGFLASAALGVLFIPGFLLMRAQPESVIAWMRIDDDLGRVWMVTQSFLRIGFDGRQPTAMVMLVRIASATLLLTAAFATLRDKRAIHYALCIVTPIAGAIAAAALGFTAYFPIRFESVLVVPFVVWFWLAVDSLPRAVATACVVAACAIGAAATWTVNVRDPRNISPPYLAAMALRDTKEPLVASGVVHLYIEALHDRPVAALPAINDVHPWVPVSEAELERDLAQLPPSFIWAGENGGDAARVLRRTCAIETLARYGAVDIARVKRAR